MATRITIEQGGDANRTGKITIVEIVRMGEVYEVTASKTGFPSHPYRKFQVPRQPMPLYQFLTDIFSRLAT